MQQLSSPVLSLARLPSATAPWVSDTAASGFRPKGYVLDEQGLPSFRYQAWGTSVEDAVRPLADGKGIRREVRVQNPSDGLMLRLAEGATIEYLDKGRYLVDGKSYYLQMEETSGAKPLLRRVGERQELVVPVRDRLVYSILF